MSGPIKDLCEHTKYAHQLQSSESKQHSLHEVGKSTLLAGFFEPALEEGFLADEAGLEAAFTEAFEAGLEAGLV